MKIGHSFGTIYSMSLKYQIYFMLRCKDIAIPVEQTDSRHSIGKKIQLHSTGKKNWMTTSLIEKKN